MTKIINDGYSALLEEHDAVRINPTRDDDGAPVVVEEDVSSESSEPSADGPSDDEPSAGDSSSDEPKTATHDGAGWYTVSDSDEKIRGKEAVLEAGYVINDED